jgi:hypothetical protein
MTPRRWRLRDLVPALRGMDRTRLAGVFDFSYQHFALGDVLTSQVIQSCQAIERGCKAIDCYVFLDPQRPAAPVQRYITPENYWTHLDNLFPALLCAPMLASVRVLRDRLSVGFTLAALAASRVPTWPSLRDQLRRRMPYPLGHEAINRFHARHGYILTLSSPRGYAGWARRFVARHLGDRFLVAVNLRQSRLTSRPATMYRDAPLAEWYEFFRAVSRGYPNVRFLVLGGFGEWEHGLLHHDNVLVPRAMGLTLAHELALLHDSRLFMGSSSGFATMATFGDRPYVITGLERYFAGHAGMEPEAERYPFAAPDQYLVWRREDAALLLEYFERLYRACRGQDPREVPVRQVCADV